MGHNLLGRLEGLHLCLNTSAYLYSPANAPVLNFQMLHCHWMGTHRGRLAIAYSVISNLLEFDLRKVANDAVLLIFQSVQ